MRRIRKRSGGSFSRRTRKHGGPKRRVWRKIHPGIDGQTLEIRAVEFTGSDVGDAPMLPELLDQIPPDQKITRVTADGACDTRKCHDAIAARGAAAVMPPRRNGKPWKEQTAGGDGAQRGPAGNETPRPRAPATMERPPPPEPRRDEDALREPKDREAKLPGQRLMAVRHRPRTGGGAMPHPRPPGRGVQVRVAVLNGCTAPGIPVTKVAG